MDGYTNEQGLPPMAAPPLDGAGDVLARCAGCLDECAGAALGDILTDLDRCREGCSEVCGIIEGELTADLTKLAPSAEKVANKVWTDIETTQYQAQAYAEQIAEAVASLPPAPGTGAPTATLPGPLLAGPAPAITPGPEPAEKEPPKPPEPDPTPSLEPEPAPPEPAPPAVCPPGQSYGLISTDPMSYGCRPDTTQAPDCSAGYPALPDTLMPNQSYVDTSGEQFQAPDIPTSAYNKPFWVKLGLYDAYVTDGFLPVNYQWSSPCGTNYVAFQTPAEGMPSPPPAPAECTMIGFCAPWLDSISFKYAPNQLAAFLTGQRVPLPQ